MMTIQPLSERVASDVLAAQCVLESGVPHDDVGVWERVREERLMALIHDLTSEQDPSSVLRAIDAICERLDGGEVRTTGDVLDIVRTVLAEQRLA